MAKIELERLISKRGILSRKEAARAIINGQVKVNGQILLCADMYETLVNY